MNYSKRIFLSILFLALMPLKAFSCTMPYDIYRPYSEKDPIGKFQLDNVNIEDYLNSQYGSGGWRFVNDMLFLDIKEANSNQQISIKAGYKTSQELKHDLEIILLVKEKVRVIEEDKTTQERYNVYAGLTELGTYKLSPPALPYISIRVNFLPSEISSFIAIFVSSSNGQQVEVITHEAEINMHSCSFTYYIKGNKKYMEDRGLYEFGRPDSIEGDPGKSIPDNTFKVTYFDTESRDTPLKIEYARKIVANGTHNHSVAKYSDLGIYAVGNFQFDSTIEMQFNIVYSYSSARILVNDIIIYDPVRSEYTITGANRKIIHTFEKGSHKVELDFISDYFAPGLQFSFIPVIQYLNNSELEDKLQLGSDDLYIAYINIYEGKEDGGIARISVERSITTRPILFLLQSTRPVNWIIENPLEVPIKAIVVGKSQYGSSVKGDIRDDLVHYHRSNIGSSVKTPETFLGRNVDYQYKTYTGQAIIIK